MSVSFLIICDIFRDLYFCHLHYDIAKSEVVITCSYILRGFYVHADCVTNVHIILCWELRNVNQLFCLLERLDSICP